MYRVIKRLEISASHKLDLPYESKCKNLHGHNWILTVYLQSETLENGMVFDFTEIKKLVKSKLDHKNMNDYIEQPTAENVAKYVCDILGEKCYMVEVQEGDGNIAVYEK